MSNNYNKHGDNIKKLSNSSNFYIPSVFNTLITGNPIEVSMISSGK